MVLAVLTTIMVSGLLHIKLVRMPASKWEETSMFNIGLDFFLFNNRVVVQLMV